MRASTQAIVFELTDDIELPSTRRGVARGRARVDHAAGVLTEGALSDEAITRAIDRGVDATCADVKGVLARLGHDADTPQIGRDLALSKPLLKCRAAAPAPAGDTLDSRLELEDLDDESSVQELRVQELKDLLEEVGLKKSGNKTALVARLVAHLRGDGHDAELANIETATKKELDKDRIYQAIEHYKNQVDADEEFAPSSTNEIFRKCIAFCRLFNAIFRRQSRERSGRFFGQHADLDLVASCEAYREPTRKEMTIKGKTYEDKLDGGQYRVNDIFYDETQGRMVVTFTSIARGTTEWCFYANFFDNYLPVE